MTQDELRQRHVAYDRALERLRIDLARQGVPPWEVARHFPPFPDELRGFACGARSKRTGQPCKLTSLYANGRCKFHGGLSTGPKTEAGRQQSRENGKQGGRPRKKPSP